jgi:2-dehydropantoate 2-reductase
MIANNKEPILIVGTGALACLFAARLAAAGNQIWMLGTWPEGLAALSKLGVTLVHEDGSLHRYPVKASADPSDFSGVRYAHVLVKSWQTERAANQLLACLAVDGVALTLQNGLGNSEKLVAKLGAERVALGITTGGATLLGPGQVRAGGNGKITVANHPRIEALVVGLSAAGFQIELTQNVDALAWGKLVVNAAINPLTALLDITNGELLKRPTARELSAALANEVAALAGKKKISLPFRDSVSVVEDVIEKTADNHSSMLQDVRRGATTEIDAINGAVVKAGREIGLPTPVNEVVWKLVTALQGNE